MNLSLRLFIYVEYSNGEASDSFSQVVASVDWPQVSTYRALVSSQGHREEIIQDLYKLNEDTEKGRSASGMIRFESSAPHDLCIFCPRSKMLFSSLCRDHLIHFYKRTNRKPDRIIFYRFVYLNICHSFLFSWTMHFNFAMELQGWCFRRTILSGSST